MRPEPVKFDVPLDVESTLLGTNWLYFSFIDVFELISRAHQYDSDSSGLATVVKESSEF
jgi:hypothetical protein